MMEKEFYNGLGWGLFLGVAVALTITAILYSIHWENDVEVLGGEICDKAFNLRFYSYSHGELRCLSKLNSSTIEDKRIKLTD